MLKQTFYLVNQTFMTQILAVAFAALLFGVFLATSAHALPLRPGVIGLLVLLLSAWMARRYWQGLRADAMPSSPERVLWHSLVGYCLLGGHLATMLYQLGPDLQIHSLSGHALAVDSWTLVIACLISFRIARDPQPRDDERDALIQARCLRAGHYCLVVLLIGLILLLGFGTHSYIARCNQPMLAHLLILTLVSQCIWQTSVQLRDYWLETCAERSQASL